MSVTILQSWPPYLNYGSRIKNDPLLLFPSFKVYQDSSLAYFIDASDPKYGNWMNFIQCARNQHEQNLKALQYNGCLYFESVRDIPIGEELLVWYDDLQYDLYMGIPIGFRGKAGSSSSSRKFCFLSMLNAATPGAVTIWFQNA